MIISPSKKNLVGKTKDKSKNINNLIKVGHNLLDSLTEEEYNALGSASSKIAYLYPLYSEATTQTHHEKRIKGDTSKTSAEKLKASIRGFKILAHYVQNVSKVPIKLKLGKIDGRDEDAYQHIKVLFGEHMYEYELQPGEKIALASTELLVNFLTQEYGGYLDGGNFKVHLRNSTIKGKVKTVKLQKIFNKKDGRQVNVIDIYMPFSELKGDHEVIREGYERLEPALIKYVRRKKRIASLEDRGAMLSVALTNDINEILLGKR